MDWLRSVDYTVFREVNTGLHSSVLDPIFTFFSYSGLGIVIGICILLLLVPARTRGLVIPLYVSLLISGVLIADVIFKPLLDRDRPSNLASAIREEAWLHSSFPSGHSSVSFATAFTFLFLTWHTSERKYGWLLLIWACCVGLSRIYRGVHWPTDVLAGCMVGLFTAALVTLGCQRIQVSREHRIKGGAKT